MPDDQRSPQQSENAGTQSSISELQEHFADEVQQKSESDDVKGSENSEGDLGDEASEGLFDSLLTTTKIFSNKDVLRASYTPSKLPHREDQIDRIAAILVSALRGDTPSNILLYGKTGTGKTAVAKYVSDELADASQRYDIPCEIVYINCQVTDTKYRVLARLANRFITENQDRLTEELDQLQQLKADLDSHNISISDIAFESVSEIDSRIDELETELSEMEEVPMTGWPTDQVYQAMFDAIDYTERIVVIILDEIDVLVEKEADETLYNLSRINGDLDNAKVSMVGISNDLKFTEFLDPRIKSSLGEEEIVFPPYDANQLRDILTQRAEMAYESMDVLDDDVIPLCAAFAAQEHGDARRALDLLRTAGELANRSGAAIVDEDHVRAAQEKIELDQIIEAVRSLPTQSQLVLYAIIRLEESGVDEMNTGAVYNVYKQICNKIDMKVLTQRRVTDLLDELDMLGIINAVVVSKGRYGRSKQITLSVPTEDTKRVIKASTRLDEIEGISVTQQSRLDDSGPN